MRYLQAFPLRTIRSKITGPTAICKGDDNSVSHPASINYTSITSKTMGVSISSNNVNAIIANITLFTDEVFLWPFCRMHNIRH